MSSIRRRKSSRKMHDEYRRAVIYGGSLLLAFLVLLFLVLGIRSCIKGITTPPPPDDISLIFNDTYKLTVHNHITNSTEQVSLDEYIFHVVSAEMPAAYGIEALKAQAVAARTYAIQKSLGIIGEEAKQCNAGNWDICTDSSCCQSWKSIEQLHERWGNDYNTYASKIYQAVVETSGVIAVYNDKPINAMYHSSSGGHTVNVEDVYGGDPVPYLRGVSSPGEECYSGYSDTITLTKREAAKIINKEFGQSLSKKTISNKFLILEKNEYGLVEKVCVGTKNVTGRDIRHAFSLRSSNFNIDFDDNHVIINVRGYGHGVGMSQAGAGAMAKKGYGYTSILTHYYTGIQIKIIGDIL